MKLKIAITADPELPVPPKLYGGIERIIDMHINELQKRGHEVTLFANKDSEVNCKLIPYKGTQSQNCFDTIKNMAMISSDLIKSSYDIVHSYGRMAYLLPVMPLSIPKIMSFQREPTIRQIRKAIKISSKNTLSFTGCSDYISDKIKPFADVATIYNGVPLSNYSYKDKVEDDAPLIFLGRIEKIKGTHIAVRVAQASGRGLIIAGNIPEGSEQYFDDEIKPYLDDKIIYTGPVNDIQKNELLGRSLALLMPIEWDEPFGIVMAEAMACGTPVIGFGRGAVPEIVQHDVTGYISKNLDEMVRHVGMIKVLSREKVRSICEERFSDKVVTSAYIERYIDMIRKVKL